MPSHDQNDTGQDDHASPHDGDLTDLLSELRVLLPGTQTLTAFLVILPFNSGFQDINDMEKGIYVVTFLCSILSLILFAAPAAQHRLERPLRNRAAFKNTATKYVIAGLVPLSIALVLVSQLVMSQVVVREWVAWAAAAGVAVVILALWWTVPLLIHGETHRTPPGAGNSGAR